MKKVLVTVLIAIVALSSLAAVGCGGGTAENKSGLNGTLTISGSTSMEEVNNILAEEFMKKNPGVEVKIQALGSSQGIQAAVDGAAQIGASSRALKSEEKSKTPELKEIKIALDGIAVVVNPQNGLNGLSKEQIQKIFKGEITNWKDVGGTDRPITVVRREDGSGTLGAFCELIMGVSEKDAKFAASAVIQNSTGQVLSSVAGNPDSIGFVSMGNLDSKVKALKVDGVEANVDNVINGKYAAKRPFEYVVKGEPTGLTKAFIDFALSADGQALVKEAKAIPLPK